MRFHAVSRIVLAVMTASLTAIGCGTVEVEEFEPTRPTTQWAAGEAAGGVLADAVEKLLSAADAVEVPEAARARLRQRALDVEAMLVVDERFAPVSDLAQSLRTRVLFFAGEWPQNRERNERWVREALEQLERALAASGADVSGVRR